jgi:membrane protein YdbS with pleckstrin-like domain
VLALGAVGWRWGIAAHQHAGYGFDDDYAVLTSGVIVHRVEIVRRPRIQSTRTTASPLQRRADLATLHLDAAGRAPRLADVDATAAGALRRSVFERHRAAGTATT